MKKLNKLLEIMKEHQKFDRLVQGTWLSNKTVHGAYRGCFFGCAMQTAENAIEKACAKYDLPLWIGYWSESVFEGLKPEDAVKWPVQLLEALINFSGDTGKLCHDLSIKRLSNLLPTENKEVNSAIELVIYYHKNPNEEKQIAARSAAWSAANSARSASESAESANSAWSAWSAAESAWSAAESANSARSAAESAINSARSDANSAAWCSEIDWILELLEGKD